MTVSVGRGGLFNTKSWLRHWLRSIVSYVCCLPCSVTSYRCSVQIVYRVQTFSHNEEYRLQKYKRNPLRRETLDYISRNCVTYLRIECPMINIIKEFIKERVESTSGKERSRSRRHSSGAQLSTIDSWTFPGYNNLKMAQLRPLSWTEDTLLAQVSCWSAQIPRFVESATCHTFQYYAQTDG